MMAYTARNDVPLKPFSRLVGQTQPVWVSDTPQVVFELDTGDLVAMTYSSKWIPESNTVSCRVVAWMVDAEGDAQGVDPDGAIGPEAQQPIAVEFKHNCPIPQVEALTASGIAAAIRDLAMGVPATDPPAIPWPDEIRQQINIRYAIAAAKTVGEIFDLATVTVEPVPPLVVE
jgi:hypothetical protein